MGVVLSLRQEAAPLTAERLEAARRLWESRRPADYTLEIEMRGALRDRRRIEVRGTEVVRMTTGETEVAPQASAYWTVEGLFQFLETDLANAARPRDAFGVSDPEAVVLRARFDPEWGYPAYFLRHVLGRRQSVEWVVREFRPGSPPPGR